MPYLFNIEVALAALLVEATIGYPQAVYRTFGHPVTWIAALVEGLEMWLNRIRTTDLQRHTMGIVTMVIVAGTATGTGLMLEHFAIRGPIGVGLLILGASSLIAQRSLHSHVRAVAVALERDGLDAGRKAVSMIVGRDPARLDKAGVARAAIESLAENFSDGIVAPVFWMIIAGLPGALFYKATNTADSIIGHRTPRYAAFGWAAARLDDLINLPASRLSAIILTLAAFVIGGSPRGAAQAVGSDANRHRSPNAGWPEAAIAGALDLKLAGPRTYPEEIVDDAFMGSGRQEASAADIDRALQLFRVACAIHWLVLLVVFFILRI